MSTAAPPDCDLTVANLQAIWQSTDSLLDELDAGQWATQSLCPDWDVKGAVIHLTSVEQALAGWLPESAESMPPFEKAAAFQREAADWTPAQVLDSYRAVVDRRGNELSAMAHDDWARPSLTPAGPGTYGGFMGIRVFDFWVHERDMRVPLGLPAADDGGPPGEMALDEVHRSLGYIVGKKVGLPDGMTIAFRLTGPIRRDLFARVDGRAAVVDELDDPDVEVTTDSTTFMLLACGRVDPQGPIDVGAITWSGDDTWGEAAARHLAYTM